ncbi:hypothetical protein SAMN05216602_2956 [Pseudomonas argentinensis]|uniref:Uncharacterized protein n=1 Tax=Phytopseudomonas argentinensis TaxID=289370 RepID=A0A1I3L7M6_9GAMM|nr:hypothetical protein SAMN05216602_2956 [Pseudomonas argentinensis]
MARPCSSNVTGSATKWFVSAPALHRQVTAQRVSRQRNRNNPLTNRHHAARSTPLPGRTMPRSRLPLSGNRPPQRQAPEQATVPLRQAAHRVARRHGPPRAQATARAQAAAVPWATEARNRQNQPFLADQEARIRHLHHINGTYKLIQITSSVLSRHIGMDIAFCASLRRKRAYEGECPAFQKSTGTDRFRRTKPGGMQQAMQLHHPGL